MGARDIKRRLRYWAERLQHGAGALAPSIMSVSGGLPGDGGKRAFIDGEVIERDPGQKKSAFRESVIAEAMARDVPPRAVSFGGLPPLPGATPIVIMPRAGDVHPDDGWDDDEGEIEVEGEPS